MGFPVWEVRCCSCKHFSEKVVWKEKGTHARTNCHTAKISQSAATDATKDVIGQVLWRDSLFARTFQDIDLVVEIVVEITSHRRWVHSTDIDS